MKKPEQWNNYESVFGVSNDLRFYDYDVTTIYSSSETNVFGVGDSIQFRFQIKNNLNKRIDTLAAVHVIQYGTTGKAGDVWTPIIEQKEFSQVFQHHVSIESRGYTNLDLKIPNITRFGGYAVIFDLGNHGRRLATSFVYAIQPKVRRMQYPKQALDDIGANFLSRLGIQAIRQGIDYVSINSPNYQNYMQELDAKMKSYQKRHITILLMIGAGNVSMPLGMSRPHLDESGVALRTKQDYAWLPSMDDDFKTFVEDICKKYGWPNGPVTAISLWNEPWEGISISGWQADMLRYREIYKKMAEGVLEARKSGVDVLVGGGDSNSNALDKFFSDGTNDMLPIFDFLSIHYQGMESPVLYPDWNNRKFHKGRVLIWDTESWVGNTDDRIGMVIAANRSAGYDRSMGIYGGYLRSGEPGDMKTIMSENGEIQIPAVRSTWSATAAVCAVQNFIGEREFDHLLFPNGLPWIMIFKGYDGKADDGTVVISGDLSDSFGKENLLFRSVNLKNGIMKVKADPHFLLFDFYGNSILPVNHYYHIPLSNKGYYMRTDGSKGAFDRLLSVLKKSEIKGYDPVEIIAKDMTAEIDNGAEIILQLTNIMNRTVDGSLMVKMDSMKLAYSRQIRIQPNETKYVKIKVLDGVPTPDNNYALKIIYDAGKNGKAIHEEVMHVNLISHRKVVVDGKLDDWSGVLPQTVRADGKSSVTLTEAAWYPFQNFSGNANGFSQGYLAYDKDYFYFAAKVADTTPNDGTLRFANRNDNEFFYPDTAYRESINAMHSIVVKGETNETNHSFLLTPDGKSRTNCYWENTPTTQSIGFRISLPKDRITRTSLYFPNTNQRTVSVTVLDANKDEILYETRIDKFWDGAWLSLDLSGDVIIRCSALDWWYTAKVAGLFFDKSDNLKAFGTLAMLSGEDLDTRGNWIGKYGTEGYWLADGSQMLKEKIECAAVDSDDLIPLVWPEGVRQFTYRKRPTLPDGTSGKLTDNILIAFNVLPIGQDGMEASAHGTMPKYIGYKCSDYEYALNKVAKEYGGGFEIWRMLVPGMPRKHFYPRQPKSPFDGAVEGGQLAIRRDGNTLIYECAIPWVEIPDVKKSLDKGENIKFSYRVNDDGAPAACMELAKDRSVSKRNSRAFHPDWKEHWANEVEFGFAK